MIAEVFDLPDDAVSDICDGSTILVGGFVSAGTPSNLILALKRSGQTNLTAVANNIGLGDLLDELCEDRQLARVIATFAIRASGGRNSRFESLYRAGEVELELVPQGTLIERLRAAGAGLGGVLTRTGLGTMMQDNKQVLELDGERWLLERPLRGHVALIKAWRADRLGNLQYRLAGRNFNPVMATAADLVIAEVEEIVEPGEIPVEHVGTPALYVDRIVQCEPIPVRWDG
ncbi:MAG: CoA transferase subunit A [Chloroflexi bacterium]|nr:CoA transferase subunit A [Chloroflexota bacterium]MYD16342.1 CoA transferase subunit A [Chloroflexota bacterium]MYJ01924.1 CoA transferase subunit A [Chloroflexota bacterium]